MLVTYSCVTNYPKTQWLTMHTFVIAHCLRLRSVGVAQMTVPGSGLLRSLWSSSGQAVLSQEGSSARGLLPGLHRVAGRTQSLTCCQTECLSPWLADGWRPPSAAQHAGHVLGQLTRLSSEHVSGRRPRMEAAFFFYSILSISSESGSLAHSMQEGCAEQGYQDEGTIGGRCRGCHHAW